MAAAFPDEWSTAWQFAQAYRALGLQVVPGQDTEKRPRLEKWREFEEALVPQSLFDRWFHPVTGEFRNLRQMGLLTGACSGGLFVIDLDIKEGRDGWNVWATFVRVYLGGIEPETWRARSGGGGLHLFFRAPEGWVPPTVKWPHLGLDVRGQGGYIVVEPSVHASGGFYEFIPGFRPGEVELAEADADLTGWIDALRAEHASTGPREVTPPNPQTGLRQDDGREGKLTAMVWAAVVDLRRDNPARPPVEVQEAEIERLWTQYELTTKSRLGPREGATNADLLEAEGRGLGELRKKWMYAVSQWDGKVAEAAKVPKPQAPGEATPPTLGAGSDADVFSLGEVHGQPPDRQWLVDGWVALGELNSLYGGGATGKSLLALMLACSVALGLPWLGLTVRQGKVLYVSCEDDRAEIERRFWAIKHGLGYAVSSPFKDAVIWNRRGRANLLAVPDSTGVLVEGSFMPVLRQRVEAERPDLVIIDTLADVFGGNENDRPQVNAFLKTCLGGLIGQLGEAGHTLTILALGQPSRAGLSEGDGLSGSTAWENAVRSRMYVARPKEGSGDERLLARAKANYSGGDDAPLQLVWADGVFQVLDREALARLEQLKQTVAHEVDWAWRSGRPYMSAKGHPRYLYRGLLQALANDKQSRADVLQAVSAAREEGLIFESRNTAKRGWRTENA